MSVNSVYLYSYCTSTGVKDCAVLSEHIAPADMHEPLIKVDSRDAVADTGFHEGGFHSNNACENSEATPTIWLKPCPFRAF